MSGPPVAQEQQEPLGLLEPQEPLALQEKLEPRDPLANEVLRASMEIRSKETRET